MIKINGIELNYDDVTFNRNRKEEHDAGEVIIRTTIKKRWEKGDLVEIIDDDLGTQEYLVFSDSRIKITPTEYEHTIALAENISKLDNIYATDRVFSLANNNGVFELYTAKQILDKYFNELSTYQNFNIDFSSDLDHQPLINELDEAQMPQREYEGVNLTLIVYDIGRRIDAIPRLKQPVDGKWRLYFEKYSDKNELITIEEETWDSEYNPNDYATQLINKTKNTTVETFEGTWYPSADGYITPRFDTLLKRDTESFFELPDNIIRFLSVELDVVFNVDYPDATGGTENVTLELKDFILTQEEYDIAPRGSLASLTIGQINSLSFRPRQNKVEGLMRGIETERDDVTLCYVNMVNTAASLYRQQKIANGDWQNADLDGIISPNDTANYKLRFKYIAQRDVEYVAEKYNNQFMNLTTVINKQKESRIELNRHKQVAENLIDRMGTNTEKFKQTFMRGNRPHQLGDYTSDFKTIISATYILERDYIIGKYETAENFTNVEGEYATSRNTSPFTISGKSIQTNFILKDYVELSKTQKPVTSVMSDDFVKTHMNLLDYSATYDNFIDIALFKPIGLSDFIVMTVQPSSASRALTLHAAFREPLMAGYGWQDTGKYERLGVPYTEPSGHLEQYNIKFMAYHNTLGDDTNDTTRLFPKVTTNLDSNVKVEYNLLPADKDPNETLAVTYQLVHASDDPNNLIITGKFSDYSSLVKNLNSQPNIKIYTSTKPFTVLDRKVRNSETEDTTATYTYNSTTRLLDVTLTSPSTYWCMAIDNNIILAVNDGTTDLYFNFVTQANLQFSYGETTAMSVNFITLDTSAQARISKLFKTAETLDNEITLTTGAQARITFINLEGQALNNNEVTVSGTASGRQTGTFKVATANDVNFITLITSAQARISFGNFDTAAINNNEITLITNASARVSQAQFEAQANNVNQITLQTDATARISLAEFEATALNNDLELVTNADARISYAIDWVDGGTESEADSTPNVCEDSGDIGNVRELTTTTYEWVTMNTYGSQTDETDTGTCSNGSHVGNLDTRCVSDGFGGFICTVRGCTEVTNTSYETCSIIGQ